MLWINNPAGETGKKIWIRIGQEIEIEMLDIGVLIEILTGIKVGHLVGTGIQDLLVGHLDIGIIGRIEIVTELGIEIETIEGIEVHLVMVMTTQDLEVVQELDVILILYVDIARRRGTYKQNVLNWKRT